MRSQRPRSNVLFRGDRVWDMSTFDADNKATAEAPIAMPVVARMDADTGKVLSSWGANVFYMPHMLTLDHEGNVWVVDCGLHQVIGIPYAMLVNVSCVVLFWSLDPKPSV